MKRKHIAITGAAFAAATLLSVSAFAQTTMSTMPSRLPNPTISTSSKMAAKSGVALSSVSNAKQKLASASVKDSSGQTLGQVQKVKTSAAGTPTEIEVSLTSAPTPKTVQIPASELRYDQSSNMLMTVGLSATEVDSMPAVSNP